MKTFLAHADDVLRQRTWSLEAAGAMWLLTMILIFGMTYGAVMGSFGGLSSERALQMLYSATKVPILLLVSFAITLPSFFVLNTLVGLRSDFAVALRAVMATQAGLAIILAGFAPLTAVWYLSVERYSTAVAFNGLMFLVASSSAQVILRGYYRPLIARSAKHLWMVRMWAVLYALVAMQMAWILRPFIGDPSSKVEFFRAGAWDNAYVIIARLIAKQFGL